MDRLNFVEKENLESQSDEKILAISVSKPSFFEIIVNRYQEAFTRKARSILGDREEVIDIVQDTFTKIYLNAGRFQVQEGASFKSWGYKILINTTFTYYKKLKRKGEFIADLDDEIIEILPDLKADELGKKDLQDYIVSVLSRMPSKMSKILQGHFIDDKSQKQLAQEEGVSVSAIKTRVHRAKKEFKKIVNSKLI